MITNKELRDILKKNNIKNYSKFNKKDLLKAVNNLINIQNGGSGSTCNIPPHMLTAQRNQHPTQYLPASQQYSPQQYPPPPYPPPSQQYSPQQYPPPNSPPPASQQYPPPPYPPPNSPPPPYPPPSSQQYSPQQYPPPNSPPPASQQYPPPPYPPPPYPPPQYLNTNRIQSIQQIVPVSAQPQSENALQRAQIMWQTQMRHSESRLDRQQQPRNRNTMQNRISCPSLGWAQQINDCWIDSAYYSMFVPSNLKDWFFTFFTDIRSSEFESLRNFSEFSFEYLKGIDGNPEFISRKQYLKKNILINIRNTCELINPDLFNALSARSAIRELYNTTGTMNRGGNGDASLFFKFISIIQPKLLFFEQPSWVDILSKSNGNKVIQKYIRDKLRTQNSNPNIDIVAIDASYYTPGSQAGIRPEIRKCMNDITVLEEILIIGNFSLEAVIRGNRVHYTLDFKCQDNDWYEYNNMKNPRRITRINVSSRNWQGIDGLIFIFRRTP